MVEFRQFKLTSTGNEIDFMQSFIDVVCGLANDITCEDVNGNPTDAETILTTGNAQFYFNFGGGFRMRIARERGIGSGAHLYGFYNGDSYMTNAPFSYDDYQIASVTTRSWLITYIKGENTVGLWVGSYAATVITESAYSIMRVITDNIKYLGHVVGANILTATFYSTNSSASFTPMLQYSAGAGNIDYIEKAVFVSGGTKAVIIEEIYSCSTVVQWSTIALPIGKNFLAIHTNAMIELQSESE